MELEGALVAAAQPLLHAKETVPGKAGRVYLWEAHFTHKGVEMMKDRKRERATLFRGSWLTKLMSKWKQPRHAPVV